MKTRKQNSTNSINEIYWKDNCGIAYALSVIGGRWKLSILSYLFNEKKLRYNELKKRLTGISERMLILKLKELESDGLVNRIIHQQVPPKVEYELTELGYSLKEILVALDKWGEANVPRRFG
jgi:DNA-binding HxlR family transcriptional regulator